MLAQVAAGVMGVIGAAGVAGATADPLSKHHPPPMILLELFTSEGCSSCPPADRLLEQLAGDDLVVDVEVVPLSFHVDYWNHLGWRDPYSNADFSRRQESYAAVLGSDVFTPQLVVDGGAQLVGSDRREALAAIARMAKHPRASVEVARVADPQAPPRKSAWKVAIDAGALAQRPPSTYLFVALTEDGLASSVARGENAGKMLRHVGVVRVLRPLGRIWLDQDGKTTRDVRIDLDPSWQADRLHIVAWLADGPNGRVLGSARIPY
jgi:hypothetical protein